MGEYSREQRNQLSRAVANNRTGSRQLKEFVDNRQFSMMQRDCVQTKAIAKKGYSPWPTFDYVGSKIGKIHGNCTPRKAKGIVRDRTENLIKDSFGGKDHYYINTSGNDFIAFYIDGSMAMVDHYGPFGDGAGGRVEQL